jgi:hypothetical protein
MVPVGGGFAGRNPVAPLPANPYAKSMKKPPFAPIILAPLLYALSGCGPAIHAPSLLPRAIEKQSTTTRPVAAPVDVAPITPALQSQITRLMTQVKADDSVFTKADRNSGRLIVAGRRAAEGSEAWVVAQQAQSELEAAQQGSAAALGELETLLLAQTQAAASDATLGGVTELTAAHDEASAIVERQIARLQELTR